MYRQCAGGACRAVCPRECRRLRRFRRGTCRLRPGERRTLYEPLAAFGRVAPHAELQLAVAMSAVVLAAAVVAACFGAVWVAVAVSLALLFVTVSLWLVSPFANPESRGPEAFVRTAQNFCEKIIVRNITMSKKYVTFITEKKQ